MFPIETLKHLYLVPIGGYSNLLNYDEIGINSRFLSISNLRNERNVTITMTIERKIPYLFKEVYKVVPVSPKQYDAWLKSKRGEAVLSENHYEMKIGDMINLNAVLSKYQQTK